MLTIEATPIYGNTAAPFFPTDDVSHSHHEKWAKEYSGGGACIQSKARATFKQCQIYSNTLRSPNNQQRTGYVAFGAGVAAGGYFGGTAQGQAFFEGCDIYDNKVASPPYRPVLEKVGAGVSCTFIGGKRGGHQIPPSCTVDASTKIHDNFATDRKGTLTPKNLVVLQDKH